MLLLSVFDRTLTRYYSFIAQACIDRGGWTNVTFITPASFFRRLPIYRWGANVYGHPDSITGPLILAGIVHRAGHDVEVYEELNGSFDMKRLVERTDVLCLYTMTANAKRAYDLADLFHHEGHARVIVGGMHASAMPEESLRHADQVIVGEGEMIILDVVENRIADPVVYAQPLDNLDDAPFPDYSVLKTPCEAADVLTTRGCPFHCTFCTTSRMFHPYRQRSVDNVIGEIRLYKQMGFEYMNFEDDNFTADKERAKKICRRMIDEGLVFKQTFFFGRTDMANDPELLDLLAKAHLTRVLIGIESLNQDSLDQIDKHQTIADIKRAGEACRDHGIEVIASLVLGIDCDSKEDIERSVDFAKSIDAYQLQPAILTPFPGTPVYRQFVDENRMILSGDIKEGDWTSFDMMNVTFQPKRISPWELQMTFCQMARRFYTRRSAMRIGLLYGSEYGWRRYGLAVIARLGSFATRAAGTLAKGSSYYRIKHADWMFAHDEENPTGSATQTAHNGRQARKNPLFSGIPTLNPRVLKAGFERTRNNMLIARRRLHTQECRRDPYSAIPKRPTPSERSIIPIKVLGTLAMALPVVVAIGAARAIRKGHRASS